MDKTTNIVTLKFTDGDFITPLPIEKRQTKTDMMVPFGSDNTFPQQLLDIVESTSLLEMMIDKTAKYIYGKGIDHPLKDQEVDDKGNTLTDLVNASIYDYITYGAFAIQVRRNALGDIKKLDSLNIERIRTNEEMDTFWYNSKWSKYAKADLRYEAFSGDSKQNDSIFYFKNPTSKHIYGRAPWWSSLTDAVVLKSINDYNLSTVNNAFCPSAAVTLKEGKPTSDEAKEIEKEFNKKFAGSKNAAKMLLMFADGPESAPEITMLQPTDGTSQYLNLLDTAKNNLFAAFSLDPLLVGMHDDSGVFAQQAYQEAYDLYNETVIKPTQSLIIRAFKRLGYDFTFIPFSVEWSNNQNNIIQ